MTTAAAAGRRAGLGRRRAALGAGYAGLRRRDVGY